MRRISCIASVLLPVLFAGCSPGSGSGDAARGEGPLGPEDLPDGYTAQVTTIEARAFEDEWKSTERRYTTLDAEEKPLEVVFIMDHPTRAFDTAITYDYDVDGHKRLETTWHWKQEKGWTRIGRVETTYDARNRPVEERASSLDADGWIDSRLVQYGYDHPDGAVTRVISVPHYDAEGMPDETGSDVEPATMWRNDRMEERFVSGERIDSVRSYSWEDSEWLIGNRTTFLYSEDGKATETVIYRRGTHAWVPFLRTTHRETGDGEYESLIHNRRGSEWVVTRRETTRTMP